MIAHHAAMARPLGEQLGLSDEVARALGASYERWDGKGWPGELAGEDVPWRRGSRSWPSTSRWRTASAASTAASDSSRSASGKQFDPELAAPLRPTPDDALRRARRGVGTGTP